MKEASKSPKMRDEGSARAQVQSGPQESQTYKQRDTWGGGKYRDGPTGGLVGVEGAAQRGGIRKASRSPPPELEKLARAHEGGAL